MADSPEPQTESYRERRNLLLKGVEPRLVHKAWFTLAHLLLEDGATVVNMGCSDGTVTYAMAAFNPKIKFIGVDKNKGLINRAKAKYKLVNLEFRVGDAASALFDPESLDSIINAFILHEIYSASRYSEEAVRKTLATQFKMLKKGGTMFIRDYARPPAEEFVLLQVPDTPGTGKKLTQLSTAELLIWYAQNARSHHDMGCAGFFLEELPRRTPHTRLFRLPHKWAYEFIMHRNDLSHWESEAPKEYTYFTMQDFNKELRTLGSRVQYSGPHWDETIVNEQFEQHFRLYRDDGTSLGYPPTSYIAVATKMPERKSLNIEERRPSLENSNSLKITAVRNRDTGEITDIVSRSMDVSEIIPYHVDGEGQLKIYLHDGVVRSVSNAVPRQGMNIDGRRWSGHLIEPYAVEAGIWGEADLSDPKDTLKFSQTHMGLKPASGATFEHGPQYYPAPDYIDERIHTLYLKVHPSQKARTPRGFVGYREKFQEKGALREFSAQQILNAITVGLIPSARLEMQVLSLFQHLGLKAETWSDKHLNLQAGKIKQRSDLLDMMHFFGEPDSRFKEVKGASGQLRPIHSTFVEEGQTRGVVSGLSAESTDFVVHALKTVNTAVVLPLTEGLKGDVHAGFAVEYLPVPQRHEGSGFSLSVPSFNIPAHITNLRDLKKFVAEKFSVTPEMVIKLGESYFSHVGMTPQRIYPFVIAAPAAMLDDPGTKFIPFYQFMLLQRLLSREPHFMTVIARAYRYFHDDIRLDAQRQVKAIVKERFSQKEPDWSIPISYENINPAARKTEPEAPEPKVTGPKTESHQHLAPPIPAPAENLARQEELDEKIRYEKEKREGQPSSSTPPQQMARQKPNFVLSDDFPSEVEAFLDALEKDETPRPAPEKW